MTTETKSFLKRFKKKWAICPPVDKDPRLLSSREKNIVLVGLALCASSPGLSSTIYFPGLPDITADLHASSIATTLTAALFVLAMGIAPIFWSAISDHFQIRRFLLILSMIIFAVSSLGCAFINNIWGLVVLRCVQSIGSSCGQSLGAGAIADCFAIEERGAAFGKFFFGVFIGPLIGPIIGGFLIMSDLSWRATFWFCVAFAIFNLLYVLFLFPETYRASEKFDVQLPIISPVYASSRSSSSSSSTPTIDNIVLQEGNLKSETSAIHMEKELPTSPRSPTKRMNPIGPFLLLRHPFVLIAGLTSAIAFSSMFAVETIIPDLYEELYGFESWKTGLSYIGAGVGNLIGAVVGAYLSDRHLLKSRERRGGHAVVEDRLTFNLWPSFVFMLAGLLLFGWGTAYRLSVWAPIVAFGIQTFGMNQIMTSTSAYIVDGLPAKEASSATAAAHLLRMVLSCVLTLVANPMVSSVGPGWTCVFLAGLGVLGILLLAVLHLYGARLRKWSGFSDNENE